MNNSEWISVEDALPETTERVLIYRFSPYGSGWAIDIDRYHELFGGWLESNEYNRRVTHWRPLPEPPIT